MKLFFLCYFTQNNITSLTVRSAVMQINLHFFCLDILCVGNNAVYICIYIYDILYIFNKYALWIGFVLFFQSPLVKQTLLLDHSHIFTVFIPINTSVLNKPSEYHVQKHCYFAMSPGKTLVI